MPDEAQASMMATAAMVTAGSIIAGASTTYGPLSARGYTRSGGEQLDQATRALNEMVKNGDRDEFIIQAEHRATYARDIKSLVPERERLEQECKTVGGSLKNWYAAREFYVTATTRNDEVKTVSQNSYAELIMRKANDDVRNRGYYPPSGYYQGDPHYPSYQSYSVYRQ